MSATIIDGRAIAQALRNRIAGEAASLKSAHGIVPGVAVVLVGDDPASAVYVAAKSKAVHEAGFKAFDTRYPATLSERALIERVAELNADSSVHGILVQMPLPAHIDPAHIISAIDPIKDVDGLHPINAGLLANGAFGASHGLVPCTPLGSLLLLRETLGKNLAGR